MAILETILRRRWRVIAVSLALAGAAATGLARLAIDNSARVFFVEDHRALAGYRRFQFLFGPDQAVRIVASGPGVWTADGLAWLRRVEEQAARLPGVAGTVGLWGHHRWRLPAWPPPDPERFRAEVITDLLDRNAGWVSADGEVVTVLAVVYDLRQPALHQLLDRLGDLLTGAPPGVDARLAGLPLVNRELDEVVVDVAVLFLPLLAALAVALLVWVFRDAADVVPPLLLVAVCLTAVFGTMGWVGARLNMVSSPLIPLLFVIAVATAVHVSVRCRHHRRLGADPVAAVVATYRDKGWAVLWTGVTTFAGFGSLAVIPSPPVRALGLWAAGGVALLTAAAFTLYPALLAVAGRRSEPTRTPSAPPFEAWARRRGRAWGEWAVRRRRRVVALFAAGALAALAGLPRLRPESNLLTYFRPSEPVRAELEGLERRGLGVAAAELVLDGPTIPSPSPPPDFEGAGELARLARLAVELRADPLVLGALGPAELVAASTDWVFPEGDAGEGGLCFVLDLMRAIPAVAPLTGAVLAADGEAARVTLLVPMLGFDRLEPLFERAAAKARQLFPDAEIRITGQYPLVLAAQRVLLRSMLASLALTLVVVTAVFVGLVRGGRLTAASLAPNLWPVLLVVGAMGWSGVPLDSTTVIIAAVTLGLAVDDTLHVLGAYRRLAGELAPPAAAAAAVEETAGGLVLTTLILAGGFAVCGLSRFLPVSRFGALLAVGLLFALLADLLLLPALLAGWDRTSTPTGTHKMPDAGHGMGGGAPLPPRGRERGRGSEGVIRSTTPLPPDGEGEGSGE